MSNIDTTPNTVATNALGALDFTSLIGGPMDAIIKAQALAAKTTYEFINEVGLTVDPDTGEKKPVNVIFQYNNNGQVATLTIPLLTILPIPNIEVSEFIIDFIANISASSSSQEETSSDTDLDVDASAEASIGVGPFSLKVNAKANYSSKQHSKASQNSKYSVEYTMNVNVKGGQSDMPAGLQTVLNILQSSSSTVSADDLVQISPASLGFVRVKSTKLQITVKDKQGYFVPCAKVDINCDNQSIFEEIKIIKGSEEEQLKQAIEHLNRHNTLSNAPAQLEKNKTLLNAYKRKHYSLSAASNSDKTAYATKDGIVEFEFMLVETVYKGADEIQGTINITTENETQTVSYYIIPDTAEPELPVEKGSSASPTPEESVPVNKNTKK